MEKLNNKELDYLHFLLNERSYYIKEENTGLEELHFLDILMCKLDDLKLKK
jgi:hypothetical protein